jgi:hypothetical protein
VLLALVLCCIPLSSAAPTPPTIEWQKTYPLFQALSVIQTSDGGYAMAGVASSADGATLLKTDSVGNVLWQKALGDVVSVAQTQDSNLVVFCQNGDVVKTDSDGNILSTFSLGVSGVRQGIITDDGTYIAVGNSIRIAQETYVWLRKTDFQGNIIWDLNFTGGFQISAIVNTADHGCALSGNWKNNFWLARLDSNGNQQWSQNYVYGNPLDTHLVYSVAATGDGGFVLAGTGMWQSGGGMIPWLIKISTQGYEQWNLPYGQYPSDSFSAVVQTANNGYFVVKPTSASLLQMDSSGSEVLNVPLGISEIRSSLGYPATSIVPTSDGGYTLAGTADGGAFLIKLAAQVAPQPPTVKMISPQTKTYDSSTISLTFNVNDQNAALTYILDDQQTVAITGNTTLAKLPVGSHNITVYASDQGLVGDSQTVYFTVVGRFPMDLVFAAVTIAAVAGIIFLLYVKRLSLPNIRKKDLNNLIKKQRVTKLWQNRILWNLIIIGLCFLMVFVLFFFPYVYYSSVKGGANSSFEVGVSYVYERDSVNQIYNEVAHIKELGLKVIRVNLVCDSNNPSSYLNTLSDTFFAAVRVIGIKVALIISNLASTSDINFYLDRWGSQLTYIQILNEPDVASSWQMGALFTDDEAGSKFDAVFTTVTQHQLSSQYYTNFSPAFIARTNLPITFSHKLNFLGFDVFMDSFLTVSPDMIKLLQKITNKDVVISEFGMSTSNDAKQSDYIINGLNLFRNMGLKGCWIVYWNSADNDYGIRGRLAEQKVGEWIAQNT